MSDKYQNQTYIREYIHEYLETAEKLEYVEREHTLPMPIKHELVRHTKSNLEKLKENIKELLQEPA